MTDDLVIVVGGMGYWGKNLTRCFQSMPDLQVQVIDPQCADRGLEDAVHTPTGVVIATPPVTHAPLALRAAALFPDAKILIEKPMVLSRRECRDLHALADNIMVDHTFLYVPEFEYIKRQLDTKTLGKPVYAYSDRLNLGKFQACGVLWDLAPHDLALFEWLFDSKPKVLNSLPMATRYAEADVARLDLQYGDVMAHLHMSWIHPTKVRRTTIVCTEGMLVYDMMAEEKVKIYHPAGEIGSRTVTESYAEYLMRYRGGDIVSPAIPQYEPLAAMCQEFMTFCTIGTKPRSGFSLGQSVVNTLCDAE